MNWRQCLLERLRLIQKRVVENKIGYKTKLIDDKKKLIYRNKDLKKSFDFLN